MGMMNALVRGSRGRSGNDYGKRGGQSAALDSLREATLDEGVKQLLDTINNLLELDARFEDVERDLIGKSPITLERMPSPEELGLNGFVPRLMEAALLIGAITRRMHLRVGVVEGALGKRARPVTDMAAELLRTDPASQSAPAVAHNDAAPAIPAPEAEVQPEAVEIEAGDEDRPTAH